MTDASNKLTLHLLEMLINANGPLTVSQLADTLQRRSVTEDMREVVAAAGGSEEGLRGYLCRYPSLFRVLEGDRVTPVIGDGTLLGNSMEPLRRSSKSASPPTTTLNSTPSNSATSPSVMPTPAGFYDFAQESEAVKYFQSQLSKREERWVPIKSISGHLSQASQRVRRAVGPQTEFLNFLRRHPHVFEVQGELVGLKDTFTTACLQSSSSTSSSLSGLVGGGGFLRRRNNDRVMLGARPRSMIVDQRRADALFSPVAASSRQPVLPSSPPSHGRHSAPVCMTASEYKAVIFLKACLEEAAPDIGGVQVSALLQKLGEAREAVRNTVGWTLVELQEFLSKQAAFFELTAGGGVLAVDSRKMNILISGSRSAADQGTHTLTNRRGTIYHVAKLWGIIDLGQHEHVFFDKSILRHVGDLQKYFKHGETLYFNAILAAKDSRAKWRATQVWKEADRGLVELLAGQAITGNGSGGGGEDTDSGLDQELEEGLQLADDIKFLDDELEQEMDEMAALHQCSSPRDNRAFTDDLLHLNNRGTFNSVRVFEAASLPHLPPTASIADPRTRHHHPSTAIHEEHAFDEDDHDDDDESLSSPELSMAHSEPSTMRSIPSLAAEETAPLSASGGFARASTSSATASTSCSPRSMPDILPPEDCCSTGGGGSGGGGARTVATQTVSTGEIMATQFYHD